MTRQPYDQFSKQYLSVLFQTSGKIEISLQVSGEVRLIDFTFSPAPDKQDNLANLGLLGKCPPEILCLSLFATNPISARFIPAC